MRRLYNIDGTVSVFVNAETQNKAIDNILSKNTQYKVYRFSDCKTAAIVKK